MRCPALKIDLAGLGATGPIFNVIAWRSSRAEPIRYDPGTLLHRNLFPIMYHATEPALRLTTPVSALCVNEVQLCCSKREDTSPHMSRTSLAERAACATPCARLRQGSKLSCHGQMKRFLVGRSAVRVHLIPTHRTWAKRLLHHSTRSAIASSSNYGALTSA